MPKVGGRRKKAKSHKENLDKELDLPKVFVVKKGQISNTLHDTIMDLRKCFYPNTAMKLQDSGKVSLKGYLKVAKFYNVTHLVAMQHKNEKDFMKIVKIGGGQMNFRIINYCRMKEIQKNGGQPFNFAFREPLVILNNFNESLQLKMIAKGLQQMFPDLDLSTAKTENLKRAISFTYSSKKKFIYFRHYRIVIHEAGISNSFRQIISKKSLNLSNFKSMSEFINQVDTGDVQAIEGQQKVRLVEIGPRMKLKFLNYKERSGLVEEQQEEQNDYYEKQQEQEEQEGKEEQEEQDQE